MSDAFAALRGAVLAVLVALLAACVHVAGERPTGSSIRAMTFNIRLDLASDGANAWPHRRHLVAALIRHEAPDILGMQEVLLGQKQYLAAELPGYTLVGVGRDDGKEAGEFSPLAWRSDRFEALESGTFWLSPTPETPGKGWDAAYPRIATWAVLRDRSSGRRLRVLNTHFDHVGTAARANAARMIADWVASGPDTDLPAIVLGDFNAAPDSEAYAILAETLRDSRTASRSGSYGPPGTFNGWKIDSDAGAPIDHILVTSGIAVAGHGVVTQHWNGRLPSDHYPVIAELEPGE